MKKLLCLTLVSVLVSCRTPTSSPSLATDLPEWSPRLDEPIQLIHELLERSNAQQDMNYLASNLASLYDAELWLTFQVHLDELRGDARSKALEEQRQWLVARKKVIDSEYEAYEGGTGAPLAAAHTSMEMTKKRIATLLKIQP